jgi:cytochrome c biogenesis protein CcmG, thiol:disulfide interchange protein DsbE
VGSTGAPATVGTGTLRASMWPRLSIIAGLLTGVAAAALVIGGILILAPEPGAAPTPPPQPSASLGLEPTPSPTPTATAGSGEPSPSGSVLPSGETGSAFHVGEPAPALVVPQVGGGTIDLANLKGRPVWVNFMGTYCPPCVDEFPLMNRFATRHAEDDLVVIAIDVKEDEGTVAAFAEGLGATFPLGLDADGSAALRWDAIALPVHFWIDKDGIVRDGALGGIGPDIMARGLRTIMPGVDVQT